LSYGFRLATARKPSDQDIEVLTRALERYEDRYQTKPADADKLLAHGEWTRDKSIPATDLAARWAA
jgi:hypothetical protein